MTTSEVLSLLPGFAGLALSLFLLYRTELRRARMSLRVLAAPDTWRVSIARHGSAHQAAEPSEADYFSMHGIFAVAATNDGPRGGALWGLAAEVHGMGGSWNLHWFNSFVDLPYALPGRSCEGWSRVALILACDFDRLSEGLRDLQHSGDVVFRITYVCQGWRGRPRHKSTSLRVPRGSLLDGLKKGATGIDLAGCQVVPRARALAAERFADFNLSQDQVINLTKWALLKDPVEYVTVPDGAPGRAKLAIQRQGSPPDQGWWVAADGEQATLDRIREVQLQLVGEIQELRARAVQI